MKTVALNHGNYHGFIKSRKFLNLIKQTRKTEIITI